MLKGSDAPEIHVIDIALITRVVGVALEYCERTGIKQANRGLHLLQGTCSSCQDDGLPGSTDCFKELKPVDVPRADFVRIYERFKMVHCLEIVRR